jgi:pyruvate/2-oxoglutarate dehydrogenase complex dihydrolipoamide acyltransferase (E2) component
MVRSKEEIPHAWMMMEVDVTDLVEYRNQIKEEFKRKEGFNLTYFAFLKCAAFVCLYFAFVARIFYCFSLVSAVL